MADAKTHPIKSRGRATRAERGLGAARGTDPGRGAARDAGRGELERLCMRNLLGNAAGRVWFKDLDSRFIFVSSAFADGLTPGCSPEDLVGKCDFDIFGEKHAQTAYDDERRIIADGTPMIDKIEREDFRDRPDAWVATTKFPLRDDNGRIIGTFGFSRDVTAQRRAEEVLLYRAFHDPLTGLANRAALADRLAQSLIALERQPGRVGLLYLDLDHFKPVNDHFGHEAGDHLLVEVARRLRRVARRADTVARLGGDEFVLLCPGLREDNDLRLVADRVLQAVGERVVDDGRDLSVTGSIGIVASSDPSDDAGALIEDADVAMYEAKAAGRNRFKVFDDSQRARAVASHELEVELRGALERGELFLVYQPQFSLEDRDLTGVEALLRWRHPTRGVVLPLEFVPLAEERGLIGAIGAFVLDESCRQLATWMRRHDWPRTFTMAVNVSGRQLSDPGLADQVSGAIWRHHVEPSQLCLEVTETAMIGQAGDVADVLSSLSGLGVRIALDDFGTGYSTLAHLQRLRADVLKIDRSFIEQIGRSPRDAEIVAAVTAMAHALGMSVVAEGIETDGQLDAVASLACDGAQGFLLARPMAPGSVVALQRSLPRRAGARL